MSFDWRTDEDKGWQEPIKSEETAVSQPFWRRRWHFLLFVLLGVVAVWTAVQWQVDQRVGEATETIETELLGTHNFVLQTAVNQDEPLFRPNLSGRNPDWSEVQKTLLEEGLFLNRPMLGWKHEPQTERLTPEEVTIELAPDLRAAELRYPQSYVLSLPNGQTETVTLQQTAVYRQGTNRWLYSPPDDAFWGDWQVRPGEHITLAYTERDAFLAQRLAADLDALLAKMCADLADLNCAGRLRVNLRLATEPDSLLEINRIETMLTTGLRLNLPTPTLVGLPTDEASYQALVRAYGVQLVTAVLAHQIEYNCCRHQLFFRALRDYQLAQLGLQAWPLEDAMFNQMLASGFNGDASRHWTRRWQEAPPQFLQVWLIEEPDPIWQQVYMLIEFLATRETAVSPTQMMRLMDRSSYESWLAAVLPNDYDDFLFETRFLEYIYAQTRIGQQAEQPVPLPTGSITLICENFTEGPNVSVFTYDLAAGIWAERLAGQQPNTSYITTVDGQHFVMVEYLYEEPYNIHKFYLATDDSVQLLEEVETEARTEHWINYFLVDQTAEYLMRYENKEGQISMSLLETSCAAAGDCPAMQIDGWPQFSPDRQHLLRRLFLDETNLINIPIELRNELYVMSLDEKLHQPVGRGGYPFWLTEDTFGYVTMGGDGWELMTAVLPRNHPRILLSEADLLAKIPAEERSESLVVNQILANPTNPQELLLQARLNTNTEYGSGQMPGYLFKLTLTPDLAAVAEIELLRMDLFIGMMGYSPDGRYITLGDHSFSSSRTGITATLLDSETGQTSDTIITESYNLVWSPDGQWFVQVSSNYLLLRAPAYDYQHYIPHSFGSCPQVVLSVDE